MFLKHQLANLWPKDDGHKVSNPESRKGNMDRKGQVERGDRGTWTERGQVRKGDKGT